MLYLKFFVIVLALSSLYACEWTERGLQWLQKLEHFATGVATDKSAPPESSARKKRQSRVKNVIVASVSLRQLNQNTVVSGRFKPWRSVRIFNRVKGTLLKLPFYVGDTVKKNQLIALLDRKLLQIELDQAIINEKQAKIDLERLKKLSANHASQKIVSEEEVSQAATRYKLAENNTRKQKLLLSYTKIYAPFDAIVSERLYEPGDILAEYSHLLTLLDTSKLIVAFSLAADLFHLIKIDESIDFQIEGLANRRFSATVIRKSATINEKNHQGQIEAVLIPEKNASHSSDYMIPGQQLMIFIHKTREFLSIPVAALRYEQQSAYVFKPDNKQEKVIKQKVIIGKIIDGYAEVIQGLKNGDLVVVKGLYELKNGSRIQVLNK